MLAASIEYTHTAGEERWKSMIDLKKATPLMDRQTLALVAIRVGFIIHALFFNFLNDDAFISFRYADNLVRNGELVFNPGERVEGYTNFLWTMMMAESQIIH